MRSCVVIPARYESSRYPGKPLVPLLGKPMILWVAELAAKAVGKHSTFVATEDLRIAEVVGDAGFRCLMTSKSALTGTDRLAEAAEQIDFDIYINVQGDEPLVRPEDILKVLSAKKNDMSSIVNGCCPLAENEDPLNPNIPKVVTSENGTLLYLSRSAVPGCKSKNSAPKQYMKQVCIYAFTREELVAFRRYGRKSINEQHEDIEILRFFELERRIQMVETMPGSLAVDVPSDVEMVEAELRKLGQA